MSETANQSNGQVNFVGTIVGESTTQEFRMAIHAGSVEEQDIVAVDADMSTSEGSEPRLVRVWAKVRKIERLNPLFPAEAGHELAETRTDPLDTVLSFSREMVTAVCQIIGHEPQGTKGGKLDNLRYPPKPASTVYHPNTDDLKRIVLGDLKESRGLDLATLSNRGDIDVKIDGHAVVYRHLAILAMTGAGKSWTARRIVEQLALKDYPMVIFDPRGDYTRLGEITTLQEKVTRYYVDFPVFEEDADSVAEIVNALGYELTPTQRETFSDVFKATSRLIEDDIVSASEKLADILGDDKLREYGLKPDLFAVFQLAKAAAHVIRNDDNEEREWIADFLPMVRERNKTQARTLDGISMRVRRAAFSLLTMSKTNRRLAASNDQSEPLPSGDDRINLVQHGKISVVSLAGYTSDFQATLFSIIANDLFSKRVTDELRYPCLVVLEEAHNFAPAKAMSYAEKRSIEITRRIAQEGRKFGLGLVLISQRPSRLDETALSQCNSQIIMRLINPADQRFVRQAVETLNEDDLRMLPSLDVGEAIFSGQMINFAVLARVKEPESKGEREEEDAFETLKAAHERVKSENQRKNSQRK